MIGPNVKRALAAIKEQAEGLNEEEYMSYLETLEYEIGRILEGDI